MVGGKNKKTNLPGLSTSANDVNFAFLSNSLNCMYVLFVEM